MEYNTVKQDFEISYIIEKSKFLGYAFAITDTSDAEKRLQELKKLHPFATHICYAYCLGDRSEYSKSNDSGEPKGTAGIPILNVIRAKSLTFVLVAVVRYFGGVKLGAGGLVRAYSHTASLTLPDENIKIMRQMNVISVKLMFSEAARIKKLVSGIELDRNYSGESVEILMAANELEQLLNELNSLLNRKVDFKEKGIEYIYFE